VVEAEDDAALVVAWRDGNREAGKRLFERHYPGVARFFRNKVGAAEPDLIQRTFLACVEGLPRYRGAASFRSYLFSIAYKILCKHFQQLRRDRGRTEVDLDFGVESAHTMTTPTQILAGREEQRLLLAALRRLPVDYQVALELHYWEGMTAAELGEVLDLPLGTAKTRIRRGRALLEEQMAAIADSAELLESTRANLELWARQLRAQVLGEG
jgi:RNA polymerase sigma-70 factor, ECF subfamily